MPRDDYEQGPQETLEPITTNEPKELIVKPFNKEDIIKLTALYKHHIVVKTSSPGSNYEFILISKRAEPYDFANYPEDHSFEHFYDDLVKDGFVSFILLPHLAPVLWNGANFYSVGDDGSLGLFELDDWDFTKTTDEVTILR